MPGKTVMPGDGTTPDSRLAARHEWVKNRERMTNEKYQKYFVHFNPDLYD